MKEGSKNCLGSIIVEYFDYYGVGLSVFFQMDIGNLVMFVLLC